MSLFYLGLLTYYSNNKFYTLPFFIFDGYKRDIEIVMAYIQESRNDDPIQLTHSGIWVTSYANIEDLFDLDTYNPYLPINSGNQFNVYLSEVPANNPPIDISNIFGQLDGTYYMINKSFYDEISDNQSDLYKIVSYALNPKNMSLHKVILDTILIKSDASQSNTIANIMQYNNNIYILPQKNLFIDYNIFSNPDPKFILLSQMYSHYSDKYKKAMILFLPYNTVCVQILPVSFRGEQITLLGEISPVGPRHLFSINSRSEIGVEGLTLILYLSEKGSLFSITEYPYYDLITYKQYNIHKEPFVSTGFSGFYYEQRNIQNVSQIQNKKPTDKFFYFS